MAMIHVLIASYIVTVGAQLTFHHLTEEVSFIYLSGDFFVVVERSRKCNARPSGRRYLFGVQNFLVHSSSNDYGSPLGFLSLYKNPVVFSRVQEPQNSTLEDKSIELVRNFFMTVMVIVTFGRNIQCDMEFPS